MKIRKLKGDWRSNEDAQSVCQMVVALRTARDASASASGPGEFQARCNDAILALANLLMETHVEKFYEPEEKLFVVDYDVKRSGVHHMTVTAKDEAEAKRKAEEELRSRDGDWFSTKDTDFVAADVMEAKEVPNG